MVFTMGELFAPQNVMLVLVPVFVIIPFWQIFKKAGMPAWFSLLLLVPMVNLIMLYVLAFAPWKTPNSSAGLANDPRP
jgi:hypothetical protein